MANSDIPEPVLSQQKLATIRQAMLDEKKTRDERDFLEQLLDLIDTADPLKAQDFLVRTCELETDMYQRSRVSGRHHAGLWFFMLHALERAYIRLGIDKIIPVTQSLKMAEHEVCHPCVPDSFDGYRILWLSDFHLDIGHPEKTTEHICAVLDGQRPDLLVLGGDYRHGHKSYLSEKELRIFPRIQRIVDAAQPQLTLAILGNHDTANMLPHLRAAGAQPLVNEAVRVSRGGNSINVIGPDDSYRFHQNAALEALLTQIDPRSFNVVIAHSPDLAEAAADFGAQVYLTGHTHAGQLRNPVLQYLQRQFFGMRRHVYGPWQEGDMTGFTSAGVGSSAIPIRNIGGEALLVTLRRAELG